MKLNKLIITFVLVTSCTGLFASSTKYYPSTIYIIRHACKLEISKHGPSLTPKGLGLSFNFPQYYVNSILPDLNNGESKNKISDYKNGLDVIYVTNPSDSGKKNKAKSFREIQTVSPLITLLYAVSNNNKAMKAPLIQDPYADNNYKKLVDNYIFSKENNKANILICWNHKNIPDLTHYIATHNGFSIGITKGFEANKFEWPKDDYTTVVKLQFKKNKCANITVYKQSETYGFTTPTNDAYLNAFKQYLLLYKYNSSIN